MDRFYTPRAVAEELVSAIGKLNFDYLVDFAAGRGALLAAAAPKWPTARVVASDRDARASSFLGRQYPNWTVLRADFFDAEDRRLRGLFRRVAIKRTLLLLNPPFSCRGAERHSFNMADRTIGCSLALAFLLRAAQVARSRGSEIACLLPSGSLGAKKDGPAWEHLRHSFDVEVVRSYERFTFNGCHPRTTAVRLVPRRCEKTTKAPADAAVSVTQLTTGELVRGWVKMHSKDLLVGRKCLRLVHTTDLQEGKILVSDDWVWTNRSFSGPAVLIPRVGQPRPDKLVVCDPDHCVALSDCVIAVRSASLAAARRLRDRMLQQWETLDQCYTGTGARYVTVEKLARFLDDIRY